ncbi:MAG: DMT family transporter [candidate division WOR-3 bacterium]|nr:MAG: DMT family transporter [candidate division WOR-3 bacterium]
MITSVTAALIAMVLIGSADILNKLARQRGVPIGSYLIIQTLSHTLIILILSLLSGGIQWQSSDILYSLITAIFGFTGVTLMLHSLTQGHASVNYTIFRSSFVLSAAAAILLMQETLSAQKIAGIVLTCLAIFTFFYEPGRFAAKKRSLSIAILAMIVAAGFQIVLKMSTRVFSSPLSFILLMNLFFSSFVILYNILFGNFKFPKVTFILAPANGILTALATLFYVTALHKGELSTAVPIIQLSFVITAILSATFLKEHVGAFRFAGIICAAIAVVSLGMF